MGIQYGQKITTNGLVWLVDSNNPKSFPGEPTTNIVTNPNVNTVNSVLDIPTEARAAGITGYTSSSSLYAVQTWAVTSTACTGKTFTLSMWVRSPSATKSTFAFYVYDGTGSDSGWWCPSPWGVTLTDKWQRFSYSISTMTGTVTLVRIYRANQLGTLEVCAPQFEVKSHVTPFVIGTRSTTNAWKDISGNNYHLDLPNMSYDSSGKMQFVGSNQSYVYMTSPNTKYPLLQMGTGVMSVEILLTIPSTIWSGYQGIFLNAATGGVSGYGIAFYPNNITAEVYGSAGGRQTYSIAGTPYLNKTILLTVLFDRTSIKRYVNGTLIATSAITDPGTVSNTSYLTIGSHDNSQWYYVGRIYRISAYNRILTDTEISQNYSQIKTAYNLS